MKVDDFGRFYADPRRLRSSCYPLKESIRDTDVSRCLSECEKAGLLVCYEVALGRYLCILRFNQRLRVKHEKFPRPPDELLLKVPQLDDGHTSDPFVSSSSSPNGEGIAKGRGFPVTVDDAINQCALCAMPKDFIMNCFDKAESRGGVDARGLEIVNFAAYVRTEWKYEMDRKGRERSARSRGPNL
jgi:hypothetical protein